MTDCDAPALHDVRQSSSEASINEGHREVELKFTIFGSAGEAIIAHLVHGTSPVSRKLRSAYFDTRDRDLRRAGYTLRIREEDGRWTQTVKSDWSGDGQGRGEWESEVDGDAPDYRLVGPTPAGAVLGDRDLERLFEVTVDRRSFLLERSGAVIEVSLDRGEAKRGKRVASFGELELELKSGPAAALFEFAASVRASFSLCPSFVAKADRGFALSAPTPRGGRHFETPRLAETMTSGDAFAAIAFAALRQIAANAEQIRVRPSAEAIHQMRVGLRRLRSTIDIFSPAVLDLARSSLVAELKWASCALDEARNLDVFLEGPLVRTPRTQDGTASSAALRRHLLRDRRRAYAAASTFANSDRLSALLLEVLTLFEVGLWNVAPVHENVRDRSIVDFAAVALDRAHLKVLRKARDFKTLSPAKRHKLRIAAKTLRYAADVFDDVFPERNNRAASFLEATKALLGRLGELNDLVGARTIFAGHAAPSGLAARIAKRERRLVSTTGQALKDFSDIKRFWPKPKRKVRPP